MRVKQDKNAESEQGGEERQVLSFLLNNDLTKALLKYLYESDNALIYFVGDKIAQSGPEYKDKQNVILLAMIILPIFVFPISFYFAAVYFAIPELHYNLLIATGSTAIAFYYPIIRLDSIIQDRRQEFDQNFPDVLDLLIVCTQAGMSIDQAFLKVAEEFQKSSIVIAQEISILSAELTYFLDITVAYNNFYKRIADDNVRVFSSMMVQTSKYGTPLGEALEALSNEVRMKLSTEVEKKAAAIGSKLTVPAMLFSIPVLFLFILTPVVFKVMESF